MTVAISLLVHGEAVRFNRGRSRGPDDYDFKYMMGRDGKVYPYVSSQCYKRYWRESLPGPPSPVIRPKQNQGYTAGDPVRYIDDDLFGYMIAGAAEAGEEEQEDLASLDAEGDDAISEPRTPPETAKDAFDTDNIKDAEALKRKLLQGNLLSGFVLQGPSDLKGVLQSESSSSLDVKNAIIRGLNDAVNSANLPSEAVLDEVKITAKKRRQFQKARTTEEKRGSIKDFLMEAFKKELLKKAKRPTTRRTAPVRMHALVAFSGIKTAKDFQTFSRDVAYTGRDSILNPNPPGIYSGWLKTRVLVESHRIGRFYIGENMELLEKEVKDQAIKTEKNPYSRDSDMLRFIELDEKERTERLRAVLRALADIGNSEGPASGALHDGSLRPKAFVAGIMTCADSPFDDVWKGTTEEGTPSLDIAALKDAIKDWNDLFATRKLYFGLPHDLRSRVEDTIKSELASLKFEVLIDSPRKALLQLAEEAVL